MAKWYMGTSLASIKGLWQQFGGLSPTSTITTTTTQQMVVSSGSTSASTFTLPGFTTPSLTGFGALPFQGFNTLGIPTVDIGGMIVFLDQYLKKTLGVEVRVENGYIICEKLKLIFKFKEPNITAMPKIDCNCRMITVGSSMTVAALTKELNTILVYSSSKHPLPTRKYDSVGYDLYCANDAVIPAGEMQDIPTGSYFAFPTHVWGMLVSRSSAFKRKLIMPTAIIDPGFTGELSVNVINMGKEDCPIKSGERLVQLIPVMDVPFVNLQEVAGKEEFPTTERGDKGYGSTGA